MTLGDVVRKAIAPAVTLGMITAATAIPQLTDAGTLQKYYNSKGKHVGTVTTENLERDNSDPNWVTQSWEKYKDWPFEKTFAYGMQMWKGKQWQEAYGAFNAASLKNPADLESYVFSEKSNYLNKVKEFGKAKAKEKMINILNYKIADNPDEAALYAFRDRIDKDQHPETFSVEAWEKFEEGKEAHSRKDYKKSISFFTQSVNLDPYNKPAWSMLASSTFRLNGKDKNKRKEIYRKASEFFPEYNNKL